MSKNDTTKDGAVALKNDNVTYLMACLQNMKSGTAVVNHEAAGAVIGLTASGSSQRFTKLLKEYRAGPGAKDAAPPKPKTKKRKTDEETEPASENQSKKEVKVEQEH